MNRIVGMSTESERMTQARLAARIGVDSMTVSRCEGNCERRRASHSSGVHSPALVLNVTNRARNRTAGRVDRRTAHDRSARPRGRRGVDQSVSTASTRCCF